MADPPAIWPISPTPDAANAPDNAPAPPFAITTPQFTLSKFPPLSCNCDIG